MNTKITFTAEESLIERARRVAQSRHKTLNAEFRNWLREYASQDENAATIETLMRHLKHVRSAGPYSRDELNRR